MTFFLSYLLENLIKNVHNIHFLINIFRFSVSKYEEIYASKHFVSINFIFAIKLFKCPKCYSPGFVTAEIQAVVTIILFTYLIKNHILSGTDYLIGALIMCACFVIMQKTITMMIGYKYSDVFKNIKKQWQK